MIFAVEQESFSGPLGLLLELLDKKALEIKEVSLAKIADDYLAYLEKAEVPGDELADFLLVASRLIYVKSRELMPYLRIDEEEEGLTTLEEQLRAYRIFVEAAERIEERFKDAGHIFKQPRSRIEKKNEEVRFVIPANATAQTLHSAFGWVLKRLAPFFALSQASIERVQSIEEKLTELTNVITTRASMTFKEIIRTAKSKPDVVVSFLALLELVRRQVVRATQKADNDIAIEKI